MLPIDEKESYPDFGKQFTVDSDIDGYWGDPELLKDIVHPFSVDEIADKVVMDVGSGSGRIVSMLSHYRPSRIVAIEPSEAIVVAMRNNENAPCPIDFHNVKGEEIALENEMDLVFSLGVLHHAPGAEAIVQRIHAALKPGGKCVVWLYGYEGNEQYVAISNAARRVTKILPDAVLRVLCHGLNGLCHGYLFLCRYLNMPMKGYFLNVFSKFSWRKQCYVIFDQLNPSYSKYYRGEEVEALLKGAGFRVIALHHRHQYSWTAIGVKEG
ncbi:MAG: class I SAM-dependent methyltransferase [Gammaproteobacteria bacterium]